MSTPILPFELPLPWEHDADGSDIYINEPIQQVMMPRGWGWLSRKYGEQRADRIQRDAVKFSAHAVNHHQELVTRLYNLVNEAKTVMLDLEAFVSTDDVPTSNLNFRITEAEETLSKVTPK